MPHNQLKVFPYTAAKLVTLAVGICFLLLCYTNCAQQGGGPTSDNNNNNLGGATISIVVDGGSSLGTINPNLFGVNLNWNLLGQGVVDYGDLIRDRSFQLQSTAKKLWILSPWAPTNGTISYVSTGGDSSPSGGNASAGHMSLSQTGNGFNCIDQLLLTGVSAGVSYDIKFSSYGLTNPAPALLAFFADGSGNPLSPANNYLASATSSWTRHSSTITPTSSASTVFFRLCQATGGTVQVDEIRLNRSGGNPQIKAAVLIKIQQLGVKSLRWPGGTLVDTFDWKKSIGARLNRAEQADDFGYLETTALGLHEFLDLCEAQSLTPVVQVNILKPSSHAAELVEYISGSSGTTQGALRAANGRVNPWNVVYYEAGNEPSLNYTGSGSVADTGSNYASLAKPVVNAMNTKATSLGKSIVVSGVVEASFQMADWLTVPDPNVQLLKNWNQQAFADSSGLKTTVAATHGHFYTYEDYDGDEASRFKHIMSGGEVLKQTITNIKSKTGNLPIWITEFNAKLVKGGSSLPEAEFLKDFQAGMAVAQIYRTLMEEKVPLAHFFNLSQNTGFGMTMSDSSFALRPTGHVFSLVSPFGNHQMHSVSITGNSMVHIPTGRGNIASNTSYPMISVMAAKDSASNLRRVLIINSNYSAAEVVSLRVSGMTPTTATAYRFEHAQLSANNENNPSNVTITSSALPAGNGVVTFSVPAHSVIRVDLN